MARLPHPRRKPGLIGRPHVGGSFAQAFLEWLGSGIQLSEILSTAELHIEAAKVYANPILIIFRPNPSKLSSRTTADLHQIPFRATAAVCCRPLRKGRVHSGRKLSIQSDFPLELKTRMISGTTQCIGRSPPKRGNIIRCVVLPSPTFLRLPRAATLGRWLGRERRACPIPGRLVWRVYKIGAALGGHPRRKWG